MLEIRLDKLFQFHFAIFHLVYWLSKENLVLTGAFQLHFEIWQLARLLELIYVRPEFFLADWARYLIVVEINVLHLTYGCAQHKRAIFCEILFKATKQNLTIWLT